MIAQDLKADTRVRIAADNLVVIHDCVRIVHLVRVRSVAFVPNGSLIVGVVCTEKPKRGRNGDADRRAERVIL